ncbi:hypothetical protein NFH98_20700 [Halomonas sp. H33-56]|uniref:hypothetical protein n=1 Tax=Halomonas sp. H33-56 TaxID=2950873 RepID=UPI0032DFAB6F
MLIKRVSPTPLKGSEMKKLALALAITAFPITALAQDCNRDDAVDRISQLEEAGVVLGMGFIQDTASIAVDTATWENASFDVRRNLALTFECAVAGPGKALRSARIVTRGGDLLAEWDGAMKELHLQ